MLLQKEFGPIVSFSRATNLRQQLIFKDRFIYDTSICRNAFYFLPCKGQKESKKCLLSLVSPKRLTKKCPGFIFLRRCRKLGMLTF